MSGKSFSLIPFPSTGTRPGYKINGSIYRRDNALTVSYSLTGPLSECVVPVPANIPIRKNALWKETCFELFLGLKNSGQYWEFNLSPACHWNVYRFKDYRQDMQDEPAFVSLLFNVRKQVDGLSLSLEIDLNKIVHADQVLDAGVSAVIKSIDGGVTYWALTHPGSQADFHRRESFVIEL
ncbi:MAG: DOMON-like domain-containing protein [Nitrospirae bacterium]|nr:DOMON-like domain-containing protein [Nitrospirota bacterium]